MAGIVPSRRVRGTPFSAGVQAAGAKAYTVYNHMLLPSYFESYRDDYHHLKKYVQVWDVSVERQVSVKKFLESNAVCSELITHSLADATRRAQI